MTDTHNQPNDNLAYVARTKLPAEWIEPTTGDRLYNAASLAQARIQGAEELAERVKHHAVMADYTETADPNRMRADDVDHVLAAYKQENK